MARRGRSLERVNEDLVSLAEGACDEWARKIEANPNQALKLYYRKPNSKQRIGHLKVTGKDPGRHWTLVTGIVMSKRWTRGDASNYIRRMMLQLPLLRGPINIGTT